MNKQIIVSDLSLNIFAYIIIAIILFLIIRELVTWYWKINRIVDTLDRIDANLQYVAFILKEKNPDIADKIEVEEGEEAL